MTEQITAAEARANVEKAAHGVNEILRQLSAGIRAHSEAGRSALLTSLSKETTTQEEFDQVVQSLHQRGFTVLVTRDTDIHFNFRINW